MDPNVLPRSIAMQYDRGEIVYRPGAQPALLEYSFNGCGLRTFGKTTDFLLDSRFQRAYDHGWRNGGKRRQNVDDDRWIMHVALWAATYAARLPGDFVECGVNTGVLSVAICDWLDFNQLDKDFWLFDTYEGIPESQMSDGERNGIASWHNRESYEECFAQASANFAPWPRCKLVRGMVPDTLAAFPPERKVAYLSIDMNIVLPEIAAIEFFWDRVTPGGILLLDDYGWATHAPQRAAFDAFAMLHDAMILSVPTGQGIMIR